MAVVPQSETQSIPGGERILFSQAGGPYVRRYVAASVDDGLVTISDGDQRLVMQLGLVSTGRGLRVLLAAARNFEIDVGDHWADTNGTVEVTRIPRDTSVQLLVRGEPRYRVSASNDGVRVFHGDGYLMRYVRNMQIRTVAPALKHMRAPGELLSIYANPLGRSTEERERAIILGSPLFCEHTPEKPVPPFELDLSQKSIIAGISIAHQLGRMPLLPGLEGVSLELDRQSVAVGLGDGLVVAAAMAAICDVRTYSRAILMT